MILRLKLDHEGELVDVVAEKIQGKLWYHLKGETRVYEPATAKKRAGGKAGSSDRLFSPMPGKILRTSVAVGDKVKVGDTLIVMEAMKMEYTLLSELNGLVAEVTCQTGDQVKVGQILVRLKPEEGK